MNIDTKRTSTVVDIAQKYGIDTRDIAKLSQLKSSEYYCTQEGKELEEVIYGGVIALQGICSKTGRPIDKKALKKLVSLWLTLLDAKHMSNIGKTKAEINTLMEAINMENANTQDKKSYVTIARQLTEDTLNGFAKILHSGGHAHPELIENALTFLQDMPERIDGLSDGLSDKAEAECKGYCDDLLAWRGKVCDGFNPDGSTLHGHLSKWAKLKPVKKSSRKAEQAVDAFSYNTAGAFVRDVKLSDHRGVANALFANLAKIRKDAEARLAEIETQRPQLDYTAEGDAIIDRYSNGEITTQEANRQTLDLNRRKQKFDSDILYHEQRRKRALSRIAMCDQCVDIEIIYRDTEGAPTELYSMCEAIDFFGLQTYLNGGEGDPVSISNMLSSYIDEKIDIIEANNKRRTDHQTKLAEDNMQTETQEQETSAFEELLARRKARESSEQQPAVLDQSALRGEVDDL